MVAIETVSCETVQRVGGGRQCFSAALLLYHTAWVCVKQFIFYFSEKFVAILVEIIILVILIRETSK